MDGVSQDLIACLPWIVSFRLRTLNNLLLACATNRIPETIGLCADVTSDRLTCSRGLPEGRPRRSHPDTRLGRLSLFRRESAELAFAMAYHAGLIRTSHMYEDFEANAWERVMLMFAGGSSKRRWRPAMSWLAEAPIR